MLLATSFLWGALCIRAQKYEHQVVVRPRTSVQFFELGTSEVRLPDCSKLQVPID